MSDPMERTLSRCRSALGRFLEFADDRLRAVDALERAPLGRDRTGLGLPRAAISEMIAAKALDRAHGAAARREMAPAAAGATLGAAGLGWLGLMGLKALLPEFARARALARSGLRRSP